MKTKGYKNGSTSARAYLKTVGHGYECGFVYGGETLFVGNFIHSGEANRWFSLMKREITKFGKRFRVGKRFPKAWFKKFISHHLYTNYYTFVNRAVGKHTRTHTTQFNKQRRTWKRLNKNWSPRDKKRSLRAA